jgi:hypothetical protein
MVFWVMAPCSLSGARESLGAKRQASSSSVRTGYRGHAIVCREGINYILMGINIIPRNVLVQLIDIFMILVDGSITENKFVIIESYPNRLLVCLWCSRLACMPMGRGAER